MKRYIYPKKIIDSKSNVKDLLKRQDLQIGNFEKATSVFTKDEYVVLDFGSEISGGLRILTYKAQNIPVRIRFGESLTECCAELGGETNATNDHSLRDFTVCLQDYSDMTFGQTGFRFVRLDFCGNVELKSIVAESYRFQKPVKYAYKGQDATIRRIYETAKRTVDLCVSRGYVWDGIKRDRLVWIGDMHPEMLALTTLYGRVKEIEKSLDFVKAQTPLPNWMNGFPMYSMWWVIIVADYYQITKTHAFVERQIEYLEGLICLMDNCVKDDGGLNYPFYFVDWQTNDQPDKIYGARAINILAVKKGIELLNAFGRDTSRAERLLDRLLKIAMSSLKNKQIIALKYFAIGELSAHEKETLVLGGAKGLSAFMSYYILKAVASFDKEKSVAMMKEYYGAMLDKGATTFWEDFDLSWVENSCRIDEFPARGQRDIHGDFGAYCYKGFRHSLCHGWSAGVVRFIAEECF